MGAGFGPVVGNRREAIRLDTRPPLCLQYARMAYLSIRTVGNNRYIYICRSERKGDKVRPRVLEYLGNADKVSPSRLQRALDYWGVKPSVKRRIR